MLPGPGEGQGRREGRLAEQPCCVEVLTGIGEPAWEDGPASKWN
jgi:hypothetical protein